VSLRDLLKLATDSILRARVRSSMLLLAMGIGVAAVIVLTGLGEAARRYVAGEFQVLGSRLIIVIPGRSETTGIQPGLFSGETPRDLTLADAASLATIPDVERVAPLIVGSAPISARGREREVPVLGTTDAYIEVQTTQVTEGQFLPESEFDLDRAVCVIGANVRRELFGDGPAVGESLRIGERRFRVIGVLADEGRSIGFDRQELVIVPVSAAQALFNSESLFRVLVQTRSRESMARVRDQVVAAIKVRHQGEADVTVITQDALLATFDRIFTALTMTLAGIASISLAVAGVLVMNVMLVAVSQRTAEIGLLKAIGATRRQVLSLFLAEAVLLSLAGAAAGIVVGQAASWLVRKLYPVLPLAAPLWAYILAVITALVSGVVFGMLPARRAARLDPVEALSGRR
jgi:putative ABC transport system permease protein